MKKYNHDLKTVANAASKASNMAKEEVNVKKDNEVKFIENFDALIAQEQKEQQKNQPIVQQIQPRNPFKSPGSNENSNSLMSNRVGLQATEVSSFS